MTHFEHVSKPNDHSTIVTEVMDPNSRLLGNSSYTYEKGDEEDAQSNDSALLLLTSSSDEDDNGNGGLKVSRRHKV